jgi:hypothetical protein
MAEMKKYSVVGNPKYLKRVESGLRELQFSAKGRREISDYCPDGVVLVDVFGGTPCEGFYPLWEELGNSVNWTISRETQNIILEALPEYKKRLSAVIPTIDNRTTPEQRAQEAEERKQREAEQAEKATIHAAAFAQAVDKLLEQYPWARSFAAEMTGKSTHATAAEAARRLLRHHFPGHAFTVRSESFSGGNSMSIKWTLGPTSKQVHEVVDGLKQGRFDGMTDYYENDHSPESDAYRKVFAAQIKYMDVSRDDHAAYDTVAAALKARCNYDTEQALRRDVYQIIEHQSFPAGAVVTGIEDVADPDNPGGTKTVCTFTVPAEVPGTPASEPRTVGGVTVARNIEHDGVEIRFVAKPSADVLAKLKGHGWRWSMRSKCWYKKHSEQAEAFANTLAEEMNPARLQHELAGAAA